MARRRSRSRLHGLGSAVGVHESRLKTASNNAKYAYEMAATHAAEGHCKSAAIALMKGSHYFGEMAAHADSGAIPPIGAATKVKKHEKQALELFHGACIAKGKLSGLGRTRKSRRRARR